MKRVLSNMNQNVETFNYTDCKNSPISHLRVRPERSKSGKTNFSLKIV